MKENNYARNIEDLSWNMVVGYHSILGKYTQIKACTSSNEASRNSGESREQSELVAQHTTQKLIV